MIIVAWYLFKVIISSGILCGYYYIALRNKIFHRWNRFYLLISIVLSLVMPLIKINIFQKADEDRGTVVRMLQTFTNSDEIVTGYSRNSRPQLTSENMIKAAYSLVTVTFLLIFLTALYKISRLKKKYPGTKFQGINFIATDAKGTPFSFFNLIFWNNAIDLYSRQGHQIFNHEIVHVKEKHSYDKVFMNIVLLFFWMNPFFWLIQKELGMIHEFIADKEALEDNDINAFAEMVLQTVYPGQHFSITNNFFHSPLKRRLIMFTKNKNPKASYVSRLLVLPLAAVVFFAFTLKMRTIDTANLYYGKKITVIIDAAHGGTDDGAIENNIKEKDLNLSIAKKIKDLNTNENLNVILSRQHDETLTPQERVKFAEENKADLFVSIHVDAEQGKNKNTHNGARILISKNDNGYFKESKLLGSAIMESLQKNDQLPVSGYLQQLQGGVWVLKANSCPSVIIETGFLTAPADLNYITKPQNQETIAKDILNGVENYAAQKLLSKSKNVSASRDTVPQFIGQEDTDLSSKALFIVDGKTVSGKEAKAISSSKIESVNVLKGESAVKKYGDKGQNGVIEIVEKTDNGTNAFTVKADTLSIEEAQNTLHRTVYFIDGKEVSTNQLNHIPANYIESITVLKGENAIKKYGEKGKDGVIEIITKPAGNIQTDTLPDKLFTKVENEAEFPGGREAWLKYIANQIEKNRDKFTTKDFGTCLVKFIVNTDGSVIHVEDSTMKNTQLAKVAVEAISSGPKWIPALKITMLLLLTGCNK